jgi:hypothetical protein
VFEEDQPDEDHGPAARYREPDPEADLRDPETELPTVPSVDIPEPEPGAVPRELAQGFWVTVLVFNAALLVLTVGVLMLIFGVERPIGAGLTVLGLLLVRRGYTLYRALDERHRSGEFTADDDDAGEGGEDGEAGNADGAAGDTDDADGTDVERNR